MKSRKTTHPASRPVNVLDIRNVSKHAKALDALVPASARSFKSDEAVIDESMRKGRGRMKSPGDKLKEGFSATVDRKRYDTSAGEEMWDARNLDGEGAVMYDNGKGDVYLHVIEGGEEYICVIDKRDADQAENAMNFWFQPKTFFDFLVYCADYGDLGRLSRSK